MKSIWELHSPLYFKPKIPKERILFIAAKGDRIAPFAHVSEICKRWENPVHHFFSGGHEVTFRPKERGKAWYGFLADMGFIEHKG